MRNKILFHTPEWLRPISFEVVWNPDEFIGLLRLQLLEWHIDIKLFTVFAIQVIALHIGLHISW